MLPSAAPSSDPSELLSEHPIRLPSSESSKVPSAAPSFISSLYPSAVPSRSPIMVSISADPSAATSIEGRGIKRSLSLCNIVIYEVYLLATSS